MGRDWVERTHGERKMCLFSFYQIKAESGFPLNPCKWKMGRDESGSGRLGNARSSSELTRPYTTKGLRPFKT